MNKKPLFRIEAINAGRVKWLGDIILVRPASFTVLTAAAAGLALMIGIFMFAGSYTQRHTVAGQLAPDAGVLKVYAPQPGIVIQKLVSEGQSVRAGDVLYVISSERQSSTQGGVQAAISEQVALREKSLHVELIQTRNLQQGEGIALQRKLDGLQAEQANIARQFAGQKTRLELAKEAVTRSRQLLLQGIISTEMMQQKKAELLDQSNRLQAIERDQISVGREFASQRNELDSLQLRQENQLAQIERMLASTAQEWTESEARRRLAITAPEGGIVTAITAETGQNVDGGRPLVSIVPRGATLEAHLYAPSRAIGFVKTGDRVLVRFQAFPYQKFGHALGAVLTVSRAAMPPSELNGIPTGVSAGSEAHYRITVKLERQTLNAYGEPQALQAGMLIEADILQEKRRLYEWVLEPLYSLTGKP